MKKLLYILMFISSFSLVATSCTEEEVKPNNEAPTNGGAVAEPK
jgi:hypothetical protein